MWSTFARGKLLITGEYAVLDGALALALPVRFGQNLRITEGSAPDQLLWESIDYQGKIWFSATIDTRQFEINFSTDLDIAARLQQILIAIRAQQPQFLFNKSACATITADFPLNWGLGSSSTLLAAVAQWADANPYQLLADTFGGSGYDIACAMSSTPLLYQLDPALPPGKREHANAVAFDPPFKDQLFFIYLGQKQDSREGIRRYRTRDTHLVNDLSALTIAVLEAPSLQQFESALRMHEQLVSDALDLPRAQTLHFPQFPGVIKSLGAWGGDFVLATLPNGAEAALEELRQRGFVVLKYNEMAGGRI